VKKSNFLKMLLGVIVYVATIQAGQSDSLDNGIRLAKEGVDKWKPSEVFMVSFGGVFTGNQTIGKSIDSKAGNEFHAKIGNYPEITMYLGIGNYFLGLGAEIYSTMGSLNSIKIENAQGITMPNGGGDPTLYFLSLNIHPLHYDLSNFSVCPYVSAGIGYGSFDANLNNNQLGGLCAYRPLIEKGSVGIKITGHNMPFFCLSASGLHVNKSSAVGGTDQNGYVGGFNMFSILAGVGAEIR
jgi:hypothetical protein